MSDPLRDLSRTRLLRELYFSRNGFLFLLTILLSIGMYPLAARTHGNASSFWLTVATGIVVTSAYASIAVFFTTGRLDAFLRATIKQCVHDTIRHLYYSYVPAASYPATSSPDPAFNRDLNRSFISSNSYTFQGVTARYNVARLASLDTRFNLVRIIVANPTKPDSVVTRARLAQHDVEGGLSDSDLTKIRAELTDDIRMSIVGAHCCWRKADRIEFCLVADPLIDRAEIFDEDMFLARFSDPSSWGFEFPAACRFLRDSMPYQMLVQDCARLFTSRYTVRLQIPREDDPKSLFRALRKVGLDFDQAQYDRLKGEFQDLTRKLPGQMMF
jgi:hypothetical protein